MQQMLLFIGPDIIAEQCNCCLKISVRLIMSSVLSVLTEIWSWITWCWTLRDTLRLQTSACVRRTCMRACQHARSVEHRITLPQRWENGEGWHSTDPDKPYPHYSLIKHSKSHSLQQINMSVEGTTISKMYPIINILCILAFVAFSMNMWALRVSKEVLQNIDKIQL